MGTHSDCRLLGGAVPFKSVASSQRQCLTQSLTGEYREHAGAQQPIRSEFELVVDRHQHGKRTIRILIARKSARWIEGLRTQNLAPTHPHSFRQEHGRIPLRVCTFGQCLRLTLRDKSYMLLSTLHSLAAATPHVMTQLRGSFLRSCTKDKGDASVG